jgi:RNA ligase (TIGR02306 family)
MRKLVTIRTVEAVNPIEGADAIECLTVEGWKVVSQKGNFQPGDLCAYFEIDSFLPEGSELWDDLVEKSSRMFEGKRGHVLRTIKLRGQVSQGWCIPLPTMFKYFPAFEAQYMSGAMTFLESADVLRQVDFADSIGVVKYEAPIPAELAGEVKGSFPSFIQKTDQERCQNIAGEIFADLDARYEVTVKLDGTSMTVYKDPEEIGGVCSRNLELKTGEPGNKYGLNVDNTLVKTAKLSGLFDQLQFYPNFAFQGELMGPGIQGNRENLKVAKFFIFDIFDISTGQYATPGVRQMIFDQLLDNTSVDNKILNHVPVLHADVSLRELGINNVDELLAFAEGKSLVHDVREGVVFKRLDGKFSFKAISNKFLLKQKE